MRSGRRRHGYCGCDRDRECCHGNSGSWSHGSSFYDPDLPLKNDSHHPVGSIANAHSPAKKGPWYIAPSMGSLFFFFASWWGIILQAIAIVHFIRRRPDTYWLFIILFLGWIGALVYIVAEVIPDAGLLRTSFQAFPRRRRIHELERAILDNPSAGNYEELGLLYLDDRKFARARGC